MELEPEDTDVIYWWRNEQGNLIAKRSNRLGENTIRASMWRRLHGTRLKQLLSVFKNYVNFIN